MQTHVVLVHPEIHWNTGNAGRTCLAAGATLHLIKPLGFSLTERQVKRAGLDYWEHVEPRVWPSWSAFERELPQLGEAWFFSAKAKRLFWDVPFGAPSDVVLIFGGETAGLPLELHERYADRFVGMYVNEWTLDYGPRGRAAVAKLLDEGHKKGILPKPVTAEFVAN